MDLVQFECLVDGRWLPSFRSFSSANSDYLSLRKQFAEKIDELPESRALGRLDGFLDDKIAGRSTKFQPPQPPLHGYKHEMSLHQISQMLDAILMTFRVHIEARIAALIGKGFYTIGPCGEETMAAVAHALHEKDTLALHYRHLGTSICRHLVDGSSMEQILLDRARGYTVSRLDPKSLQYNTREWLTQ